MSSSPFDPQQKPARPKMSPAPEIRELRELTEPKEPELARRAWHGGGPISSVVLWLTLAFMVFARFNDPPSARVVYGLGTMVIATIITVNLWREYRRIDRTD